MSSTRLNPRLYGRATLLRDFPLTRAKRQLPILECIFCTETMCFMRTGSIQDLLPAWIEGNKQVITLHISSIASLGEAD